MCCSDVLIMFYSKVLAIGVCSSDVFMYDNRGRCGDLLVCVVVTDDRVLVCVVIMY